MKRFAISAIFTLAFVAFLGVMCVCVVLILNDATGDEPMHHVVRDIICGVVIFTQMVFYVWSRETWLN